MNKLIKTAYDELEQLKNSQPSWEVYQRISMLYDSIMYLEKDVEYHESEIDKVIDEVVENVGEKKAIEVLKKILTEFKNDIDRVSPHISNCLMNKIKEIL